MDEMRFDNLFVSRKDGGSGLAVPADLYCNHVLVLSIRRKEISSVRLAPGHYTAFYIIGSMDSNPVEFDICEKGPRIELILEPGLFRHTLVLK